MDLSVDGSPRVQVQLKLVELLVVSDLTSLLYGILRVKGVRIVAVVAWQKFTSRLPLTVNIGTGFKNPNVC